MSKKAKIREASRIFLKYTCTDWAGESWENMGEDNKKQLELLIPVAKEAQKYLLKIFKEEDGTCH